MKFLFKKLIIILLILSTFFISCSGWNSHKKKVLIENVSGIVINKYIDHSDHGNRVAKYKNGTDTLECSLEGWEDGIWKYVQIGDSIIKPMDSLSIIVKKQDGSFKDFKYGH